MTISRLFFALVGVLPSVKNEKKAVFGGKSDRIRSLASKNCNFELLAAGA